MSNDFIFQCTLPDQTAILSKHQMNECFNLVTTTSCCRRMSCMHFRRIHKIDVVFFIGSCFSNYYFHVCFKIPGLPAKRSLNVYDHEATLHVRLWHISYTEGPCRQSVRLHSPRRASRCAQAQRSVGAHNWRACVSGSAITASTSSTDVLEVHQTQTGRHIIVYQQTVLAS